MNFLQFDSRLWISLDTGNANNMHHQSFHIQPRYSRPCKARSQLKSSSSQYAKSSELSQTAQIDISLLSSRRFSLLSPISPKPRTFPAESTPIETDAKFQMSPDRMKGKQTLEKGLKLVTDLYGPVPQLRCRHKNALKQMAMVLAAETAQGARETNVKEALSATLLNLQDFESQDKQAKRRKANMSLPNLTSLIKLKITPASPRCKLKRQETNTQAQLPTSPRLLPVLLPRFSQAKFVIS